MTTQTLTLADFLLARIAEDHADAMSGWRWKALPAGEYERLQARALAECEAKRRIVEWHKNWPVLVETPPQLEPGADPHAMTMRMTQQIMWTTEQEYRGRFGSEPPTGPILRFLALPYADHRDFREEWRT